MTNGLGFCASCGTARSAADQKFCASCGAVLAAMAPPPAEPVAPVAPPVEAAPPPPPAWALPPAPVAPVAPPTFSMGAPVAPVAAAPVKSRISPVTILAGLVLIAAIAGVAYMFTNNGSKSSSSGSPHPTVLASGAGLNGASSQAGNGSDLSGAASAFSTISSYKFSMTLAGGDFGSILSALNPGSSSDNAPFTMSGTITLTPKKAADIDMAGFHMIEIDGYDYLDMGGTGSFFKTPASGSSLADSFSPSTMFSSAIDTSAGNGWTKVGTETKNGVSADHYQASTSALAEYGSSLGVTDATWSADVWIATDGGYPVSMDILATASDNSVAYEIKFDITNVNDPANTITAPTNVTGG